MIRDRYLHVHIWSITGKVTSYELYVEISRNKKLKMKKGMNGKRKEL
jgi:hypothetical protein